MQAALPPLAEARHVSVAYGPDKTKLAIEDVSLTIGRGEIVVLLGPSGCGKSTLLRTLIGLHAQTSGEVLAGGRPLTGVHPEVALVFQNFALFPWLTVRRNIALAIEGLALDPAAAEARITHCIDLIGLEGFEEAYPKELSGGMRQRVGVARALARGPKLLCMDEPFSALDVFTAESLRREIYRLVTTSSSTGIESVLLITHNIEEAVFLADRVAVMGRNPGHIREIVPIRLAHPRDYHAPEFQTAVERLRDLFVADLLPEAPTPAVPAPPPSTMPAGAGAKPAQPHLEPLPDVSLGHVIGLMEVVSAHGGQMNVFELDELTEYDFGHTLAVVKAGEMLGFLDTPRNMVVLTEIGRTLLDHDTNGRKAFIHERLLTLETFRFVTRLLAESPTRRRAKGVVVAALHARLPSEPPAALFDTVVYWGRYAELLGYEPEGETLYLDEPAPTPVSAPFGGA